MVRIDAFQGRCSDDLDTNFARAAAVVELAGKGGADFLCFPEGYLSNYKAELAIGIDDPRLSELTRQAGRFDMVVLIGLSEQASEGVFNTALVFHRGQIIGRYRKTMLTGSDRKVFAPDYDLPVFEAKGIRFGVIICHDSSFVEPALTMRWKGAQLLFSPHYNSLPYDSVDEHRILVRNNHIGLAALLQVVLVRANVVGGNEEKLGYGDSTIFSPLGEAVAQAPLFREALISAEFERSVFGNERWRSRREIPLAVREQLCRAMREFSHDNDDG